MRRFIPPAWFLSAGLVVLLVAGFGYADRTRLHWYAADSQHPVERVVSVSRKCEVRGHEVEGGNQGPCWPNDPTKRGDRLEVTVMGRNGVIRTETVSPQVSVNAGDTWRAHPDPWVVDLVQNDGCRCFDVTVRQAGNTEYSVVLPYGAGVPQVGGLWPPR